MLNTTDLRRIKILISPTDKYSSGGIEKIRSQRKYILVCYHNICDMTRISFDT